MTDPKLQVVPNPENPSAVDLDPFNPENLRLDPSTMESVSVKKLLTTIPVRKPAKQVFFRTRPGLDWRESFPMIELKDDREEYIVHRSLVQELSTELVYKTLRLAITRQGVLFFLPLRSPGPDGRDMEWWRSLREHAERAETHWIRVVANRELGAYEAMVAADKLSEPEWPSEEYSFWDLIRIAFKNYLISDINHPVIQRLRGLA